MPKQPKSITKSPVATKARTAPTPPPTTGRWESGTGNVLNFNPYPVDGVLPRRPLFEGATETMPSMELMTVNHVRLGLTSSGKEITLEWRPEVWKSWTPKDHREAFNVLVTRAEAVHKAEKTCQDGAVQVLFDALLLNLGRVEMYHLDHAEPRPEDVAADRRRSAEKALERTA